MRMLLVSAIALAAVSVASTAAAAPTITVTETVAPNAFGSPSYNAWVNNSIHAQLNGLSTYGAAGPTQYNAESDVLATEMVATGVNSWRGKADPGTVFGPAYANELGNRMLFGLFIDGGGTQFSISQLSFVMDSDDPGDLLDYAFGLGGYNYSNDYRGILFGGDGMLGGGDDIFITGGANNQLVDALVGRGSGNVPAAYCPGCTIAQQQAAIDASTGYLNGFALTNFTGKYTLHDGNGGVLAEGDGAFRIHGAVPEPGTWALMILGFGGAGAMLRNRRAKTALA